MESTSCDSKLNNQATTPADVPQNFCVGDNKEEKLTVEV